MANALGVEKDSFVFSRQTHTTNVRKVTLDDKGKGLTRQLDYQDVDGLVTDVPGLCLSTFYADCVPLYFVDPVQKAIGLSHSGWRGTVGKIGAVTIQKMQEEYGSNPEDIIAAIGPSICQDCYEVSEDVIVEFQNNFDEKYWKELYYRKENGKYQLNLWKANEIVLAEAGILKEHIAVTNLCTCCNSEVLFSHRASNGKRGNLAAFMALK
jgi:YfiH family protein